MSKLNKYLVSNFFVSFVTLFLILFTIASMVFLLKISNVTAVLKIDIFEFIYLYFLSLPQILFFTLPLTFFITSALSLAKLSENSELIVILSLGVTPRKILKPFLLISLFISFVLLFITVISVPSSNILYRDFLINKKNESAFNFSASSAAQKFGDWNIFVEEKKDDGSYSNSVLYNTKNEVLIISESSKIIEDTEYFRFSVFNGMLYKINDKFNELQFKQLDINKKLEKTELNLKTISEYIKNKKKEFFTFLTISFFPVSIYFFLANISFFHNRYEKNHAITFALIISVIYFVLAFSLAKIYYLTPLIPLSFLTIGYLIYKKRIKRF
jgi:lipopolysaccharide export system permease protein